MATSFARADASLLRYVLDSPVGGSNVASVDVLIVELDDSDGASGLGFSYVLGGDGGVVLAAVREQLARCISRQPVVPAQTLWRRIAAGFNRTGLGPNVLALAAIDVAVWDLEARRRGVPLGVALGGDPRAVSVYGSGGFSATQSIADAVDAARAHVGQGYTAVKPRARGARSDAALLSALRAALPDHVHLMLDANEKCDLPTAHWLGDAARAAGVLFLEEPLPHHDIEGYRALAAGGTALATGEHLQGRQAFLPFLAERLVAVIQPDLAMAGGLTPILELAALAEAFGIAVSPHFLPGLFVHVAAAAPSVAWLEDFPLLEPLFDGWPPIADGATRPGAIPGHGLTLRGDAARWLVS